ncbi:MAG: ATP-binding cassette domain-containing protein, partial [Gammaproteobacteria bacterium]
MNAALDSTAVPGLAAARLTVRAGARELVRELTVRFAPGEVVAILGRNGSGKTLTLHTLAGLRHADGGEVRLDGAPLGEF